MFHGFGTWQLRVSGIGYAGAVGAIFGAAIGNVLILTTGISLGLMAVILLVLSAARGQNRRTQQIKSSLARLEVQAKRPGALHPKESAVGKGSDATSQAPTMPNGAEFEYASRMKTMQSHFETFALRSRSRVIRDSFARAATAGTMSYADLARALAVIELGSASEESIQQVKTWRPESLLALARLAANQRSAERDLEDAVRLFACVEKIFGTKALGRNDRLLYVEALGDLGSTKALRLAIKRFRLGTKFPVQSAFLWLNALRAADQDEIAWLEALNRVFQDGGLTGIGLRPGSMDRIDRLTATASVPVSDGPLVSIIMPTHNGSGLIETAITSLVNQTWQNLEIIVVDDCSDGYHRSRLEQVRQLDSRIVLLHQETNLGAYCARNLGLEVAKGQFVTVHDDDDWSHHQKIELQVRHLMDNPELPGNMSQHARCTPELNFLRINNNPQFCQPNFSSLMVKTSVLRDLGGWDTVNRGADAEFRDRLAAVYGTTIPVVGEVPMSFTRTREGSLTSGEMWRGYVDSSRLLYLAAYQRWHKEADGRSSYTLNSQTERAFSVPRSMLPGMRGQFLGRFDVVFATDFRFPGGTSSLTLAEITAAAGAGLRVGVMQLDSPLNKATDPLSDRLFEALELPQVEVIGLKDLADVSLLVVRHPSVATFLDAIESNLSVNRCVLIVNNPPVLQGGKGMVFDLPTCVANLDRLFRLRTLVVAESHLTRDLCRGLVATSRLAIDTWPGLVEMRLKSPTCPAPGSAVVGRHSRDHDLKWPTREQDFNAAYKSVDGSFRTAILGGTQSLTSKFGPNTDAGITVYPFGSMDVSDFLDSVHFWVYFHDDRLTESFGMATAEAMAAGKVVILPPYMEKTFGAGAVYGQPKDVAAIVERFTAQPELFAQQSKLAQETALQEFSSSALFARIDRFSGKSVAAV
ncbi:glycosyltransferase family A protein [Arthrobacter sp. Leaf69]|uniref:glycosyltransferase family A protein n=1 Tax=Arthrobacter sp. Leaf69 TaxID=1736232 RepID=UPI0009EA2C55|nr:glycosyltransferase family A protein [Arthrobacter sp. Leaf69]